MFQRFRDFKDCLSEKTPFIMTLLYPFRNDPFFRSPGNGLLWKGELLGASQKVMPIDPQSEIQVKFLEAIFKETDEKRGEILAKFSVHFRPSISREIGHRKFHANSSTHQDLKFHTAEPEFFHSDTLGVDGPKEGVFGKGVPFMKCHKVRFRFRRHFTTSATPLGLCSLENPNLLK